MAVGWFVECRGNHFCVHAASHVGHFFRTLVDEQNNHIGFGVIFRDGVGDVFQQNGFTSFWLSHNQTTLSLADRCKHIHNSGGDIRVLGAHQVEFLFWEQWHKVLKWHTVAHKVGGAAVDGLHFAQWKIFFAFLWWTNGAEHHITVFQTVVADL